MSGTSRRIESDGSWFLAWLSQARDQAGEQPGFLEKETGGQQNPRPGRESDIPSRGLARVADLGARVAKVKGETSNLEHRTSNFECGQAGAADSAVTDIKLKNPSADDADARR